MTTRDRWRQQPLTFIVTRNTAQWILEWNHSLFSLLEGRVRADPSPEDTVARRYRLASSGQCVTGHYDSAAQGPSQLRLAAGTWKKLPAALLHCQLDCTSGLVLIHTCFWSLNQQMRWVLTRLSNISYFLSNIDLYSTVVTEAKKSMRHHREKCAFPCVIIS